MRRRQLQDRAGGDADPHRETRIQERRIVQPPLDELQTLGRGTRAEGPSRLRKGCGRRRGRPSQSLHRWLQLEGHGPRSGIEIQQRQAVHDPVWKRPSGHLRGGLANVRFTRASSLVIEDRDQERERLGGALGRGDALGPRQPALEVAGAVRSPHGGEATKSDGPPGRGTNEGGARLPTPG
jgi:hypothetical protein